MTFCALCKLRILALLRFVFVAGHAIAVHGIDIANRHIIVLDLDGCPLREQGLVALVAGFGA